MELLGLFFIGMVVSVIVLGIILKVMSYEGMDDTDSDNSIWW
jgi:hypothetical protein